MGWRFRKRIKVLPGVSLNLGKKSSSVSFGGKGFRVTVGAKGTRTTVGIPGTGLSYTSYQKHDAGRQPHGPVRWPDTKLGFNARNGVIATGIVVAIAFAVGYLDIGGLLVAGALIGIAAFLARASRP